MFKKISYVFIFSMLGCIDPVSFKFEGQQEHLVVEAKFTNVESLNYIKLSESQSYNSPYNKFVEDANVYIASEEGEYYSFYYTESGLYYPETGAQGIAGHTYTLHVNGYESQPVTMRPVVSVDSIYFAYDEQNQGAEGEKESRLQPGYQLFVDYQDPVDEDNFYRWSYKLDYEVDTQPEKHLLLGCINCPLPDPLPCCEQCWVKEWRDDFIVTNDRLTNGQKVLRQSILFLPFERYRNVRMKLQIYQHSITEEAYLFFSAIELQENSEGGIFDPPPSALKGNMFNPEDSDEQVIGIFDASTVSMYEVVIDSANIPYPMQEFVFWDDCQELENSTTIMPEGWLDE